LKSINDGHLDNIESQIRVENVARKACEGILALIEQAPYDILQLNSRYNALNRRSFVNSSPVFEDLKYSGHLSTISEPGLRHSIFKYYQYVDRISFQLFNMSLVDHGYTKNLTVGPGLDFSLDVEPFSGAEDLILSQLENNEVRFTLHNMMVMRGRTSSLQAYLLDGLKAETLQLINRLKEILE
jgi:hypothetical protein